MGKLRANSEIISDKSKNPVTTSTYIKHGNQWLDEALENMNNYVTPEMFKHSEGEDISDMLSSTTKIVNLEGGTYTVSNDLNCRCSGIINGKIEINNTGNGIVFENSLNLIFNNLKIESLVNYESATSFKYNLIYLKACKNIVVKDCNFSKSDMGILFADCEDFVVINSTFSDSKAGAFTLTTDFDNDNSTGCKNGIVKNNRFFNGYEGIKCSYYSENITIEANDCYNNIRDGIDVAGFRFVNMSIKDNNIYDNVENGIEFKCILGTGGSSGRPPKSKITSEFYCNIISDNKISGEQSKNSGITIQNDLEIEKFSVVINNNDISGSYKRGIRTSLSAVSNKAIVKNNFIHDLTSYQARGITSIVSYTDIIDNIIVTNSGGPCIELEDQLSTQEYGKTFVSGNMCDAGNHICIQTGVNFTNSTIINNELKNDGTQYPIYRGSGKFFNNYLKDVFLTEITPYPMTEDSVHYRVSEGMVVRFANPTSAGAAGIIADKNYQINSGNSGLPGHLFYYGKIESAN